MIKTPSTRSRTLAAAALAILFAFVFWRLIRDRIKRIPPGVTAASIVPDLGALPIASDERLPESDAGRP